MDPAWMLAAESLALDSIVDIDIRRSPAQEALRIPTLAVVWAGLVVTVVAHSSSSSSSSSSSTTSAVAIVMQPQQQQRDRLLERLQTLYYHQQQQQHQAQQQQQPTPFLFRWSRTLLPEPEWQAVIDAAVAQRKLELEQRAAQMTRELFNNSDNSRRSSSSRRSSIGSARRKPTNRNHHNNAVRHEPNTNSHVADPHDDTDDEWAGSVTTDGVDENQRPSGRCDVGTMVDENDDKDWTRVQRRNPKSQMTTPPVTTVSNECSGLDAQHTPPNELWPPMHEPECWPQPTKENWSSSIHIHEENATSQISSGSPEEIVAGVAPIPDPNTQIGSLSDDNVTVTTVIIAATQPSSAWDDTMGRSAAAAADVNTTVTLDGMVPSSNDSSHTEDGTTTTTATATCTTVTEAELVVALRRQWQEERRDHEAAVQALQLRLYIAETRLKTYEEALVEHNRVVAGNTAVDRTTPERAGFRDASGEPHFSRVWRNPI